MERERGAIKFNVPTGRKFKQAHSEDRRFGKTRWRGCQPPQIRFGRGTEEMKPEDEP
jgi:hypothetical protein